MRTRAGLLVVGLMWSCVSPSADDAGTGGGAAGGLTTAGGSAAGGSATAGGNVAGGGTAGGTAGGDTAGGSAGGDTAGGDAGGSVGGGDAGGAAVSPPMDLRYSVLDLSCRVNRPCELGLPTTTGGAPTRFSILPDLPVGMALDPMTGAIGGTPTSTKPRGSHTVFASNAGGSTSATFTLTVLAPIATCAELQAIPPRSGQAYQLAADLDCGGLTFQPIQDFRGSLDGRGFVIRNLDIVALDGGQGAGLFATTTGASIQDVGLVNAQLTAAGVVNTGLLIGEMRGGGSVRRTFVSGSLVTTDYTSGSSNYSGGLIGQVSGSVAATVEDVFSRAAVAGGNDSTGGLIGALTSGATHEVRRAYAAPPTVSVSPYTGSGGSRRFAAFLSQSWSNVSNSFGAAQPSLVFANNVFGISQNNVGLVANATATAADGGVAALQGTGLASRPPFESWDFAMTWQETTSFPTLRGFTLPTGWDVSFSFVPASQRVGAGVALVPMVPVLSGATGLSGCQSTPPLPMGLSLDPTTCTLTGTAVASVATTVHRITASSSAGPVSAAIVLMAPHPVSLSYPQNPARLPLARAVTLTPIVTGGDVISCSVTPALPAGLSLGPTCIVSGTPTALAAPRAYAVRGQGEHGAVTFSLNLAVVDSMVVSTCAELQALPPQTTSLVQLANDIDCAGVDFRPLQGFAGAFDGQGFVVRNLRITSVATADAGTFVGLFGTTQDARIENVGLVNARVTSMGAQTTGALVGTMSGGLVRRAFVSGAVVSTDFASGSRTATGGLVGLVSGSPLSVVEDAFSRAAVFGGNDLTGGLVGGVNPGVSHELRRSYVASPSVRLTSFPTSGGSRRVGAFVSLTYSTLRDSFGVAQPGLPFTTNVFGSSQNNVGLVSGGGAVAVDGGVAALQGTGLSTRSPFQPWDFTMTWQESPTSFPTLRGFSYPAAWDVSLAFAPAYERVTPGSPLTTMAPTLTGATGLTGCTVAPPLPSGLMLDGACAIVGTRSSPLPGPSVHTISAMTSAGPVTAQIVLLRPPPSGLSWVGGPFTFDVTNGPIAPLVPTLAGGAPASCTTSPALPPGLVIDPTTCVISGAPTARTAQRTYSVVAMNEGGQTSGTVTLGVIDPTPELAYPAGVLSFVEGVPVVPIEPISSINVASVSISPLLPTGLVMDPVTGVISGTPSMSPSQTYTVTAANSAGTARSFNLSLSVSAPTTPAVQTPTHFAIDGLGRVAALWRSSNRLLVVQLSSQGSSQPPSFAFQHWGTVSVSMIAKAPGSGAFVVGGRVTFPDRWVFRVYDALGQATSPVVTVPAGDSWGDLGISDTGDVAVISKDASQLTKLSTFSRTGVPTSAVPASTCQASGAVYAVHVAVNAAGRGVATCQGHLSDPIRFRRFDLTQPTLWLDATWTTIAATTSNSSWYDSHLVGINSAGDFVVSWATYNQSLSRVSLFNAAGALVSNVPLMTVATPSAQWFDTTAFRQVRAPTVGTDFLVPIRDGAFSTMNQPFFNGYARVTAAGVLRGTASGGGFDTATLATSGTTPWVLGPMGPTGNPFTLIP